jgi:hypothetical protein
MLVMKNGVDFKMTETTCRPREDPKESEDAFSKIAAEQSLSFYQTKIYLTLSKKGPLAFESISKTLKIDKTEVCRAILRLQKLGFVYVGEVPPYVYPLKIHFFAR